MVRGAWGIVALALILTTRNVAAQGPSAQSAYAGGAVETWLVNTRACDQEVIADPWTCLSVQRLVGKQSAGGSAEQLFARMAGRPVVMFCHGNGYKLDEAIDTSLEIRDKLDALGGFDPDALYVIFDWPSERVLKSLYRDLNEKSRRARVNGSFLARFLERMPGGTRVTLLGRSDGGRVVATALHLLSGAGLEKFLREPAVRLDAGRRDLRIRAVLLESAFGHHWLNPGERFGSALPMCESVLNLHNRFDYALAVFAFGQYTGIRPAIGRVGLTPRDLRCLGPLAARVQQRELHKLSGIKHTSFPEALDYPEIAPLIASYTSWSE